MNQYHDDLKLKMDEFAHLIYKITKDFPKEELYGVTSQLRRAALSVILNYIEGYARQKNKVYKNYLEISYASLKEADYLLDFCLEEKYLLDIDYNGAKKLSDDIGAMLWGVLSKL
ncbi:four helix bundle protein [Candidatus Falkowbacteria bacterium]|nr:four helix bundle protein [Candidatus Falkowbacteria bacterium]